MAHWASWISRKLCFYLFILPPYPLRERLGPKASRPKCAIDPWGALALPLEILECLMGAPLGSSEGTLRPQRALQNMPTSPFDLPTCVFFSPFVARRTFSLNHLCRKSIKPIIFSMSLKLRLRFHFLTCAIVGRPRAPPGPPLESGRGPFGPPCTP